MSFKLPVLFTVLLFPTISFAEIDRPIDPDVFPFYPQPNSALVNCTNKARDKYNTCMDSVEDLYSYCGYLRGRRSREHCYEDVWDKAVSCEDSYNNERLACEGVPSPAPTPSPSGGQGDNNVPEPTPDPNASYSPSGYYRN